MKRRLLKILLYTLLVIAFTGYFAFSTFLFSPTEGDYAADLSTLIPRDVDFYASKPGLADDLDPFPVPAFVDELRATGGGKAFFASPEWAQLRDENGLNQVGEQIEQALASLPIDIEPLGVLGGRDLAVAGYFRGSSSSDWAVYARGNWMAKLGLAVLRRPNWFDLSATGLTVVAEEDRATISGGELQRALHVTRLRDVLVIATDPAMVQAAIDLAAVKGEDSFGGSARYYDHIQQRIEADEAELFVDYRALSEAMQYTGRWPDPDSQDFLPAFLARLFQSGALKELAGVLRFDTGVHLSTHGELASELVSAYQKQLYRKRGFDRDTLNEAARFAPEDTAFLLYLTAPFGATLREVLAASEPALRENLDGLVREVWSHPDARPLIEDLDETFQDRALLIVRENDYPADPDGPPNDGRAVFAWSLVLWSDGQDEVAELRKKIIDNQHLFGIQGAAPGEAGVYTNEASGGQEIFEYWSPFIPGTGHFASVLDVDRGQYFLVLSNQHKMLGTVLKTKIEGGPRNPRLSDKPRFQALVRTGLPSSNVVLYANPKAAGATLRKLARQAAEDEVVIDWSVMRDQIDGRVLRENFPDWNLRTLTDEQRDQLEVLAGPARDAYAREVRDQRVPELLAKYERSILYAEEVTGALLGFGLDPKRMDISLRVLMDLEP